MKGLLVIITIIIGVYLFIVFNNWFFRFLLKDTGKECEEMIVFIPGMNFSCFWCYFVRVWTVIPEIIGNFKKNKQKKQIDKKHKLEEKIRQKFKGLIDL